VDILLLLLHNKFIKTIRTTTESKAYLLHKAKAVPII